VPLFGQPIVDLLQGLHQHIGKLVSHPREKSGLQFLQGKAELLAKFVHDEKPLPVVFLADTTRSEDRLLVPSFFSPAPRALPPGAFTARATHPFNSYPHDPPQSGNAPVLLTHIRGTVRRPCGGHATAPLSKLTLLLTVELPGSVKLVAS